MYDFVDYWNLSVSSTNALKNDNIPTFLNQFNVDEQKIILKLLSNIQFYSFELLSQIIYEYDAFLEMVLADKSNYIICLPYLDDKVNHNSNKIISQLSKSKYIKNSVINDGINSYDYIIIVDDYCGSGEKIYGFLDELNKILLINKKVIYVPIFATKQAKSRINTFSFSNIIFDAKCFKLYEAKYLSTNNIYLSDELNEFLKISEKKEISAEYIRGRNNVEDLFVSTYFTPNDTIGILWYNSRVHNCLFNRDGMNFNVDSNYLKSKDIKLINKVIIKSKNKNKLLKSKVGFLLVCGYNYEKISQFLDCNNVSDICEELIKEDVIIRKENNYILGSKYKFYYKEQVNSLFEIGKVVDNQDIIESNLNSLI